MAWRIHDHVQRGEVDNRERGIVRGRIWLCGRSEPVVLELNGNACPDLAGCLLTFENPGASTPLPADANFDLLQRGSIGDLTASRKVRVPDVPIAEFLRLSEAGLPAPEHWANCLYLEWFSEANGRVVLESVDCQLTISPPAWRLTAEEESQRSQDAARGFMGFVQKLTDAVEAARHEPPEDKEWDEFDYEKFMRESDARTEKYMELLEKYQDHPERDRIIAQEMGWTWLEEEREDDETNEADNSPRESAADQSDAPAAAEDDDDLDVDEINRLCADEAENPIQPDPATEGVDWVRTEDGDIKHPLSLRAFTSSMALWHRCDALEPEQGDDPHLGKLVSEFQTTSAKLAGALDSLAYGRHLSEGPFTVAYLKRALSHLHAAQAALEKTVPKHLLPDEVIHSTRAELFGIREEILRLMKEFRGRK